jgi:DNA-binding GntR family transcriptional regulator
MQKSNAYHEQLIEAIQNRNEKKAEKIARTIIEEASQALIKHYFENSIDFPEPFEKDPFLKTNRLSQY